MVAAADSTGSVEIWDISPDERPVEDLLLLAQLLDSRYIDESGHCSRFVPSEANWRRLRQRYPNAFIVNAHQAFHWRQRQAEASLREKNWSAALFHLDRLLTEEPTHTDSRFQRGRIHAQQNRWDKSAADYARAIEGKPEDVTVWHEAASAHLAAGDPAGYCKVCAALLERFGKTENTAEANIAAWTCTLAPDAVTNFALPLRLAEQAVAKGAGDATLGTVLYRAGRLDAALARLTEATKRDKAETGVSTWLFLAMLHHRQGRPDEAKRWLTKATTALDRAAKEKPNDVQAWPGRQELRLLRREAEALTKKGR
jgi:tetratricopeptide (TPR) repeat protein